MDEEVEAQRGKVDPGFGPRPLAPEFLFLAITIVCRLHYGIYDILFHAFYCAHFLTSA